MCAPRHLIGAPDLVRFRATVLNSCRASTVVSSATGRIPAFMYRVLSAYYVSVQSARQPALHASCSGSIEFISSHVHKHETLCVRNYFQQVLHRSCLLVLLPNLLGVPFVIATGQPQDFTSCEISDPVPTQFILIILCRYIRIKNQPLHFNRAALLGQIVPLLYILKVLIQPTYTLSKELCGSKITQVTRCIFQILCNFTRGLVHTGVSSVSLLSTKLLPALYRYKVGQCLC